jgi:hypothetical protein
MLPSDISLVATCGSCLSCLAVATACKQQNTTLTHSIAYSAYSSSMPAGAAVDDAQGTHVEMPCPGRPAFSWTCQSVRRSSSSRTTFLIMKVTKYSTAPVHHVLPGGQQGPGYAVDGDRHQCPCSATASGRASCASPRPWRRTSLLTLIKQLKSLK